MAVIVGTDDAHHKMKSEKFSINSALGLAGYWDLRFRANFGYLGHEVLEFLVRFDYLKEAMFLLRWTMWVVVALASLVASPSWGEAGNVQAASGDVMTARGKASAKMLGADGLVTGSALIGAAALAAGGFATKSLTLGPEAPLSTSLIASSPSLDEVSGSGSAASGATGQSAQKGNPTFGDRRLFGKHNFVPGRVGTGEICVFCHTPQGNEVEVRAPLWDRSQSSVGEYKAYSSIGSATAAATGSVSVACLSCHDGTQAPNVVINSPINNVGIYARDKQLVKLSQDYLKGHHPVSILFGGGGVSHDKPDAPVDSMAAFRKVNYEAMALRQVIRPTLAAKKYKTVGLAFKENPDREIKNVGLYNKQDFNLASHSGSGSGTVWWLETNGTGNGRQKSDFYLYTRTDTVNGEVMNRPYVECSSCHDPHSTNTTFLRINNIGSSVCLTCHAK